MTLMTAFFLIILVMTVVFSAAVSAYFTYSKIKNANKIIKGAVFICSTLLLAVFSLLVETFILWP